MEWVTKEDAARLLGVSVDTIERRLKRGELQGKQEQRARGWRWLVGILDGDATSSATADACAKAPANGQDAEAWRELVDTLREEAASLREQLTDTRQDLVAQLEAKDRQIGELHVLLQRAQAALPAPKDRRSWWRFWQR